MNKLLTALFIFILPAFFKGQSEEGLVGKFTFNDGLSEEEISRRPIKAVGASFTEDRFGNPRSAYYLQGNLASYLNLGTDKTLKPSNVTVSAWFKCESIVYSGTGIQFNPIIITKSQASDDFFEGYFIGVNMNTRRVNINSATKEEEGCGITSSDTIFQRKWHHIVLAFDDRYIWLYMDGVMQNDNKPLDKNFRSQFLDGDSVVVGNMANKKNSRYFFGSIDDIMIYDRVLLPEEVYDLYTAPDPNKDRIYLVWACRIVAGVLILLLIIWLIAKRYKNALEKEKERNRVNMRLIELETKAIRTQMNPHFMFNSLSTLQRFMLEMDVKGAHIYLSKFSKLLRKILENSTADSTSLRDEIDILHGYVEIESMRFNHSFDFHLHSSIPSAESCHIPLLLVQPFVENAIWHGLLPLKTRQILTVEFSSPDEKTVCCVIDDNGVGREYSQQRKDPLKKKSLALDFIRQRLELLEKVTGIACGFVIIDKKNGQGGSAGTRIEIRMPKMNAI